MVIDTVKPSKLYVDTNKILLNTLKQSISQEKKEIFKLEKKEAEIKKKVVLESKQIKRKSLKTAESRFNNQVMELNKSLKEIQNKSKDKRSVKSHLEDSLTKLTKEIGAKEKDRVSLEQSLEKSLHNLVEKKREARKSVQIKQKEVSYEISNFKKKKNVAEAQIKKEKAVLEHQLAREIKAKEKQIVLLDQQFDKGIEKDKKSVSTEASKLEVEGKRISRLQIKKTDIEKFIFNHPKLTEEEIVNVSKEFPTTFENIFKERRQVLSRAVRKKKSIETKESIVLEKTKSQFNQIQNEIDQLKVKRDNLKDDISKKELISSRIKCLEEEKSDCKSALASQVRRLTILRTRLSGQRKLFQTIKRKLNNADFLAKKAESKKKNVAQLKKELDTQIGCCKKEYDLIQKEKAAINPSLKKLGLEKEKYINTLNRDISTITSLKDKIAAIDKSLIQNKEISLKKTKQILQEITSCGQEISSGKVKLNKIEDSLERFGSNSSEWKEVIGGFKREKEKILAEIKENQLMISQDQKSIKKIHEDSSAEQKEFVRRRSEIEQKRKSVAEEKVAHQKLLISIESSLSTLKRKLANLDSKSKRIKDNKQAGLSQQRAKLSKNIEQLTTLITTKQEEHKKELAKEQNSSKNLKELEEQYLKLGSSANEKKGVLKKYLQEINRLQSKQNHIAKEETLVNNISSKISEITQAKLALKGELMDTQKQFEDAKMEISKETSAYLSSLKEKIHQKGLREMQKLSKKIALEKERKRSIIAEVKSKRKIVNQDIKNKEKQLLKEKKKVELLELEHKRKVNHFETAAKAKVREIDRQISNLNQAIVRGKERLEQKKVRLNNIAKERKRSVSKQKGVILLEIKQMRNERKTISKHSTNLVKNVRSSENHLRDVERKITSATQKKIEVEKVLSVHNQHLKEFELLIAEKKAKVLEKNHLLKELQQVKLVINNRLDSFIERNAKKTLSAEIVKIRKRSRNKIAEEKKAIEKMVSKKLAAERNARKKLNEKIVKIKKQSRNRIVEGKKEIEIALSEKLAAERKRLNRKLSNEEESAEQILAQLLAEETTITTTGKPRVTSNKEMKVFLKKIDNLLGKLPNKDINKFAKSKDFKKYKEIMTKYNIK